MAVKEKWRQAMQNRNTTTAKKAFIKYKENRCD